MSVCGVSAVAILDSSVNCVCVWLTKKLTMPAYCVATNCNNSQTTPGAIDPQWGESGLSLYNSNELTFLLCRIMPICVASTSVSAISQTPRHTAWVFASKLTWYSSTLSKSCLTGSNWYGCILVGLLGQSVSFIFRAQVGHFAATPPSDVVGIWSCDLGVMVTFPVRQKMTFLLCIYNLQITVSPTSLFSASFNGNRVKNHP